MTLTELLLVFNLVLMIVGFAIVVLLPFGSRQKDDRLDMVIATMARLEQSALSTAKIIEGIHTLQEKDQKLRHDLRDYVQTLEVRLVRLEEKLRAAPAK